MEVSSGSTSAAAVSSSCLSPHWLPTTASDFEDLQLTFRDILEVTASARASRKSLAFIYKILLDHHLLPKHLSRQGFYKKVEQAEKKFQALQKAHNARCKREGSHKTKELLTLLESKFFGVTCKLQQQIPTSEQTTLVVFGDAEVERSLKAGATLTLQVDPPATDEHFHSLSKDRQTAGTSQVQHGLIQDTFQQSSVDPVSFKNQIQACQANSPQIKTDSQVKRNEHL